MKSLPSSVLAQAAAASQAPCFLVEIAGWAGVTIRWALSDAPVSFGGNAYSPRRFAPGAFSRSVEDSQGSASFSVDNADLAVSAMIAAADPAGCAVTFTRVYLPGSAPGERSAITWDAEPVTWADDPLTWTEGVPVLTEGQRVLSGWQVAGYRATEQAVAFDLVEGSPWKVPKTPARLASRTCQVVYRDPLTCAYAGAEAECDHTEEACKSRLAGTNFLNFRGVPPAVPASY